MGENVAGPWIDRRTGKTVIVRDVVNDGDELVIISSVGQIPPDVFSNFFVKVSEEEINNSAGIMPEVSGDQMLSIINNGIDSDDIITKTEPIGQNQNIEKPINKTVKNVSVKKEEPLSQNKTIIKKVFDKMENEPEIEFSVNINEWPINELKMLVDVLDIPFADISNYVISNYLNKDVLVEAFSSYLQQAIENNK